MLYHTFFIKTSRFRWRLGDIEVEFLVYICPQPTDASWCFKFWIMESCNFVVTKRTRNCCSRQWKARKNPALATVCLHEEQRESVCGFFCVNRGLMELDLSNIMRFISLIYACKSSVLELSSAIDQHDVLPEEHTMTSQWSASGGQDIWSIWRTAVVL